MNQMLRRHDPVGRLVIAPDIESSCCPEQQISFDGVSHYCASSVASQMCFGSNDLGLRCRRARIRGYDHS